MTINANALQEKFFAERIVLDSTQSTRWDDVHSEWVQWLLKRVTSLSHPGLTFDAFKRRAAEIHGIQFDAATGELRGMFLLPPPPKRRPRND